MDQLRHAEIDDADGVRSPARNRHDRFGDLPGEAGASSDDGKTAGPRTAPRGRLLRGLVATGRFLLQLILPLIIMVAAVLGYRYMIATKPEAPKQAGQAIVLPVSVERATSITVKPAIALYGTIVSGRQIELRALVAGRVAETGPGLRSGGIVAKGDQLLVIDRFDYETAAREAEAQVAEARAKLAEHEAQLVLDAGNLQYLREQLKISETDLDRAEPLGRQGTVTQRTVDDRRLIVSQRRQAATQLENNVALVDARIAQQKAIIARLSSAADRSRQRLTETRLEAPFDAYVTDVGAQVGRMVSVNDRVATLIDRHFIEVRFTLTDQQFGRLVAGSGRLEGRKVVVRWNVAREAPRYEATIERVGARVTADSGGIEVFARIDDPLQPIPLRPGAFVEVQLDDIVFADVVRLPASAVYDRRTVYIVEAGKLVPRQIEIVGSDGEALLVRGALAEGDKVVGTRLSTPGAGVLVKER